MANHENKIQKSGYHAASFTETKGRQKSWVLGHNFACLTSQNVFGLLIRHFKKFLWNFFYRNRYRGRFPSNKTSKFVQTFQFRWWMPQKALASSDSVITVLFVELKKWYDSEINVNDYTHFVILYQFDSIILPNITSVHSNNIHSKIFISRSVIWDWQLFF